MMGKATPLAHGQKGELSLDDVRTMLLEAAKSLDPIGSELTLEAAQINLQEELASTFLRANTSA